MRDLISFTKSYLVSFGGLSCSAACTQAQSSLRCRPPLHAAPARTATAPLRCTRTHDLHSTQVVLKKKRNECGLAHRPAGYTTDPHASPYARRERESNPCSLHGTGQQCPHFAGQVRAGLCGTGQAALPSLIFNSNFVNPTLKIFNC